MFVTYGCCNNVPNKCIQKWKKGTKGGRKEEKKQKRTEGWKAGREAEDVSKTHTPINSLRV